MREGYDAKRRSRTGQCARPRKRYSPLGVLTGVFHGGTDAQADAHLVAGVDGELGNAFATTHDTRQADESLVSCGLDMLRVNVLPVVRLLVSWGTLKPYSTTVHNSTSASRILGSIISCHEFFRPMTRGFW